VTQELQIDVVIPAYNASAHVEAALASVVAQTLSPARVIVVDDGSTDDTAGRVQRFAERSCVAIEYIWQANAGPSAARNAGLMRVTAAFVALLDADDTWEPDKLARQAALFHGAGRERLGLVYANYDLIDDKGKNLGRNGCRDAHVRGAALQALRKGNYISGSCSAVLLRMAAVVDAGMFDTSLVCADDWDLWMRISERWHVDYVDGILVHVRQHAANAQRDERRMLGGELRFFERLVLRNRWRAAHWIRLLAWMSRAQVSLSNYPEWSPDKKVRTLLSPLFVRTVGRSANMLRSLRAQWT
jgi:glycosyltransferase involved in cell wall biosynthesis